jgi:hypothetical protein
VRGQRHAPAALYSSKDPVPILQEARYTCTLSLISALDVVSGQHHTPAALPPETDRVPIAQEAEWGPRAGLDRCGKCRSQRNSISGPSISQRDATKGAFSCTLRMLEWCECTHQYKVRPAIGPLNIYRKQQT